MNIQKALIELTINGVVTCKQLSDFYDSYHEDKEFPDAIDFLSGSIVNNRYGAIKGRIVCF